VVASKRVRRWGREGFIYKRAAAGRTPEALNGTEDHGGDVLCGRQFGRRSWACDLVQRCGCGSR
jgi:hypothetical protein